MTRVTWGTTVKRVTKVTWVTRVTWVTHAPINVNSVGGSAGKGRGFDAWDYPRCRAFDRMKRPRGRDI